MTVAEPSAALAGWSATGPPATLSASRFTCSSTVVAESTAAPASLESSALLQPERATRPIPMARAAAAEVSRRVGRTGVRMMTPSSWMLPLWRPARRSGSR